eukprot:365123-Chlamydomonas_euryale.AAC.23
MAGGDFSCVPEMQHLMTSNNATPSSQVASACASRSLLQNNTGLAGREIPVDLFSRPSLPVGRIRA